MFAEQEAPEWLPPNVMRYSRYVLNIWFPLMYSLKRPYGYSQKLLLMRLSLVR